MSDVTEHLRGLLEDAMQAHWDRFHGPMLGAVEVYDSATQRADVSPLVPIYVEGQLVNPPILRQVPVAWPGAGTTYAIHWPLVKGNWVELWPHGVDISGVLASGTAGQPPPTRRRFSLSDAVAVPIPPRGAVAPIPAAGIAADGMVIMVPLLYLGDATATKAVGLHQDAVNKDATNPLFDFASWMTSVEAVAQAGGGVVSPQASTITRIGILQASATKVKAK